MLHQYNLDSEIEQFSNLFLPFNIDSFSYTLIAYFSFCSRNCHICIFDGSSWKFDQTPCPDWILPGQGLSSNLTHIYFPLGHINLSFLEWSRVPFYFLFYFLSICLRNFQSKSHSRNLSYWFYIDEYSWYNKI